MKIFNQSVFEHWPIEDKTIQAVITSPPYWSLRKYDIPDVIIGGDKDCKHEWGAVTKCRYGNNSTIRGKEEIDSGAFTIPKFKNSDMKQGIHPSGSSCLYCGAWKGQYGLEPTFKLYLEHTKLWMQEAIRVVRDDGIIFVNIADSFASSGGASRHKGYNDPKYPNGRSGEFDEPSSNPQGNTKPKSKCLIPERFAIMAVDELGLILRNHIVWAKPNGMPESVTDRFSKKWESVFMLVKKPDYYFDLDGVRTKAAPLNRWGGNKLVAKGQSVWDEGTKQSTYRDRDMQPNDGMKNPGDVWSIPTSPSSEKHFAMWPEKLVERMILCSTKPGDIVLDCFAGSLTTGRVAIKLQRQFVGIELGYKDMSVRRSKNIQINLLT